MSKVESLLDTSWFEMSFAGFCLKFLVLGVRKEKTSFCYYPSRTCKVARNRKKLYGFCFCCWTLCSRIIIMIIIIYYCNWNRGKTKNGIFNAHDVDVSVSFIHQVMNMQSVSPTPSIEWPPPLLFWQLTSWSTAWKPLCILSAHGKLLNSLRFFQFSNIPRSSLFTTAEIIIIKLL